MEPVRGLRAKDVATSANPWPRDLRRLAWYGGRIRRQLNLGVVVRVRLALGIAGRDGETFVNPRVDLTVQADDEVLLLAETLGMLQPIWRAEAKGESVSGPAASVAKAAVSHP